MEFTDHSVVQSWPQNFPEIRRIVPVFLAYTLTTAKTVREEGMDPLAGFIGSSAAVKGYDAARDGLRVLLTVLLPLLPLPWH
jgi:hypothetical protein